MLHMNAPALTAAEVGKLLRYPAARVRAMYRAGNFPAPIDPTLAAVQWRWSPRVVQSYIDGQAAA
jgi:hypothetical protein